MKIKVIRGVTNSIRIRAITFNMFGTFDDLRIQ